MLNLIAMLAALASAWLSSREMRWPSGGWTAFNAAVFVVSALLCLTFFLSVVIAAAIAILNVSDDESDFVAAHDSGTGQDGIADDLSRASKLTWTGEHFAQSEALFDTMTRRTRAAPRSRNSYARNQSRRLEFRKL